MYVYYVYLYAYVRFPSIFDADECQWVAAAAAVGCDTSMGAHLEVINDQFARRANTTGCKAQLEKAGIGSDDVLEIKESMLDTRKRYDSAHGRMYCTNIIILLSLVVILI